MTEVWLVFRPCWEGEDRLVAVYTTEAQAQEVCHQLGQEYDPAVPSEYYFEKATLNELL